MFDSVGLRRYVTLGSLLWRLLLGMRIGTRVLRRASSEGITAFAGRLPNSNSASIRAEPDYRLCCGVDSDLKALRLTLRKVADHGDKNWAKFKEEVAFAAWFVDFG